MKQELHLEKKILDAYCSIFNDRFSILNAGFSILDDRNWNNFSQKLLDKVKG